MDTPKATHVAVRLDRADVGPLVLVVALQLSEPFATEPERSALFSHICHLRSAMRGRS